MEPAQNTQPLSQPQENLNNPPPNIQIPDSPNPFKRFGIFILLASLLFIVIVQSIALADNFYKKDSIENAKEIKTEGEFSQLKEGFESSITLETVNFLDENYYLDSDYRALNNEINLEDVVQIGCSYWEPTPYYPNRSKAKKVQALNIVYGLIGRGNFWSVSLIKEDLQLGKTYYLPIYLEDSAPKYGRIYAFVDNYIYDSGSYSSVGSITVTKLDGCSSGDEVEFRINAILGHDDFYDIDTENGIQMIGEFRGKVNIDSDKTPYGPLIPDNEFKMFIKKYDEINKNRQAEIKKQFLEEQELYDDYFDEDYYDEYDGDYLDEEDDDAAKRDQERQSSITQILNAIGAYYADQNGELPAGITSTTKLISSSGADICSDITGTYIPALPSDPLADNGGTAIEVTDCASNYNTEYSVSVNENGRVTVAAPNAESSSPISVTR